MEPFDETTRPAGEPIDEIGAAPEPAADVSGASEPGETWEEETAAPSGRAEQAARAKETAQRWIGQLQTMIDNASREAGPVLREVAAKAAELAAVAGENAGPVAHKAANVTERVGTAVAARSKVFAADLRRQGSDGSGDEVPPEE